MTPRDTDDAFSVGTWQVFPKESRLVDGDRVVSIEPRVMSALVCLAKTPGKIMSPDELIKLVWQGRAHSDHAVYQAIADLRKALGDDASKPRYIETIPKKGYRLISQVKTTDTDLVATQDTNTLRRSYKLSPIATLIASVAATTILAVSLFVLNRPFQMDEELDSKSIAVLPFVNLGENTGNDFFSDGLSVEILNLLSRIPELKVIGRASSFAFKGKNEDLRFIGETLGVKTVLNGSVRTSGDRLRIAVQLVDVSDGAHIWSETYDRTMTNVFDVQDDVAAAIINALQIHVSMNPTRGRPTGNWKAYTQFLEAKASMDGDKRHVEETLLNAIELDPTFAEAWELLAFVYFRQAGDIIESVDGQMLAGNAAARALAIDPDLVLARAMFEAGNLETWSWAREIVALERSLQEQPNNLRLMHALFYDLFVTGYLQEALGVAERMVELDPLSRTGISQLTDSLYSVGRIDEAINLLESQGRLGINQARWDLGEIHLVAGQDDIAFSYFEAYERHTGFSDPKWVQNWTASARDSDTGQRFLERSIEEEIAALPEELAHSWRLRSAEWYLYFGYIDHYFKLIFELDPTPSNWTDVETLIYAGTVYRHQGFSAHPKYLEVAEATGIMDVWEQRGPPDFCEKLSGKWVCE